MYCLLCRTSSLSVNGTIYHTQDIVVTEFAEDLPQFGEIVDIVVNKDGAAFVVHMLQTDCFNDHFHSFEVHDSGNFRIVDQPQLSDYHPLAIQERVRTPGTILRLVSLKYDIMNTV